MRWIGQHIWDLISRFRNKVIIEPTHNSEENCLEINTANTTVGNVIDISAPKLTTGSAIKIDVDEPVEPIIGTFIKSLIDVDYDKTENLLETAGSRVITGLNVNMVDAGTNHGLSSMLMQGARIDIDSASVSGNITQKGLILNVAADGVGRASTTGGIEMEVMDGAADIKMKSHADPLDYCTIATTTNGAATIATVNEGGSSAHFTIDAMGDINLEPLAGNKILLDGRVAVDGGVVTGATSITSTAFVGNVTGNTSGTAATVTAGTQAAITTCANLVTTGTIGTGVWEGTAIATDQQSHLMHYQLLGYTTGNGSTYEMPQNLTDGQAPFEHADASSSDGLTIPGTSGDNQRDLIRMGGHLMINASTLKIWKGVATNNNGGDLTLGLFKWTPTDNSSGDITPVLLEEVVIEGKGQNKSRTFSTTNFDAEVAAGDIIFTQMKTQAAGNVGFFNSTLEVEFPQIL